MKNEKGMITLEACITVLIFMVIMFLMSGLFILYMAQNTTAHVLLQTSQSIALDNYASEKIGTGQGFPASWKDLIVKLLQNEIKEGVLLPEDNSYFATNEKISGSDNIPDIAKKRFIGYLAGGNETKADEMLKQMHVENGLNGLNFSESKIENNYLEIVLTYQLNYAFQIAELGKVEVKQETKSRLWK